VALVEANDIVPRFLGVLAPVDEVEVVRGDYALVRERLEIHHPVPEFATKQQDRQRADLAGLDERQKLEEFVERPEAAGEDRDRSRAKQEVHLA